MKKILSNSLWWGVFTIFTLASSLSAQAAYYIVGNINGTSWGEFFEMTGSGTTYTWTGNLLGSEFKITTQPNWNGTNYGSNSALTALNTSLSINSSGGNIKFGGALNGYDILNPTVTLTVNGSNLSISVNGTINKQPSESEALEDYVYLVGDMTSWALNDTYAIPKLSNGVYSGKISLPEMSSCYFRIFSNLDYSLNSFTYGPSSEVKINNNDSFSGSIVFNSDKCWYLQNWEGGEIDVNFNYNSKTVSFTMTKGTVYPEKAYLPGNFNEWTSNSENYILEPTAEEGIYQGTFYIPATVEGGKYNGEYPQFKVYDGISWIGTSESTTEDKAVELSSGEPVVLSTSSDSSAKNWYLNKWKGGDITFTYDFNAKTLTLLWTAPIPKALYLRGSFNDGTNDESYTLVDVGDNCYEGDLTFPLSKQIAFTIYGNEYFSFGAKEANQVISSDEEYPMVNGGTKQWVIENFVGGDISFAVLLDDSDSPIMSASWTTPTIYLVGDDINGAGAWNKNFPGTFKDGIYTWSLDELGSKFKITDDPTNWGGTFNIGSNSTDNTINFNQAFTYNNASDSENIIFTDAKYHLEDVTVSLDLFNGTLTINGTQVLNQINGVYVAGSFNGWKEALDNDENELQEENGKYSITLNIEETDPEFKIVVKYGEIESWFGAESGKEDIELDGENAVSGLKLVEGENFKLNGFTSGEVTFTVDTDNMTLSVLYLAPEPETITIYAYNNAGWENAPYVYPYANNEDYADEWPGMQMNDTVEIGDNKFYSITLQKDETATVKVIFNNNDNDQVEYSEAITLDQDYYFEINPANVVLIEDPESFIPSDNSVLAIYLLGDNVNGESSWDNPVELTLEENGTYTWTGTQLGSKFKFNNGSWTEGYNIGAADADNELTIDVSFDLVNNPDAQNILLATDTYIENPSLVLDLENLTVKVTGTVINTAPYVPGEIIYLKGSFNKWGDGFQLTQNEDGLYMGKIEIESTEDENGEVEIKLDCGEDHWYGAKAGQEEVTVSEEFPAVLDLDENGSNWTLTNWQGMVFDVTVDWEAGTLTIEQGEGETVGINSFINSLSDDDAIFNLQGIRVDRNKLYKGIFIFNGKKVVVR